MCVLKCTQQAICAFQCDVSTCVRQCTMYNVHPSSCLVFVQVGCVHLCKAVQCCTRQAVYANSIVCDSQFDVLHKLFMPPSVILVPHVNMFNMRQC